jgi:flagellar biosynthesis/type III secretory pathway protein FliH
MGRLIVGHGRVIPAPVMDARAEAERIVADARAEAERITAGAQSVREEARRAGHAEGLAAGREEGAAAATEIVATARFDAEATRTAARDAAVTIGRKIAEKIVGRALALDPALIVDIAARALDEVRTPGGPVSLRVHPDDVPAIETARPRLAAVLRASTELRLQPDPAVGRGGVIVETSRGRLDARLESQLDALESALRGRGGALVRQ